MGIKSGRNGRLSPYIFYVNMSSITGQAHGHVAPTSLMAGIKEYELF